MYWKYDDPHNALLRVSINKLLLTYTSNKDTQLHFTYCTLSRTKKIMVSLWRKVSALDVIDSMLDHWKLLSLISMSLFLK